MTISQMQQVAQQIERAGTGYDQYRRWSFLNKSTRTIVPGQACDCSSSCGAIAWLGGYNVDLSGTFYTGNFVTKLKSAGFQVLNWNGISSVKPGDFVVSPGYHVIFAYSATQWFSAEKNELGGISGGKLGDQTGMEVRFRAPYNMAINGRTTYILRPPAEPAAVLLNANVSSTTWTHKVVNATWLNVRKSPSGTIIQAIPYATKMRIIGYSGSWVQVVTENGVTGWVYNQYISKI